MVVLEAYIKKFKMFKKKRRYLYVLEIFSIDFIEPSKISIHIDQETLTIHNLYKFKNST